MLDEAYQGIDEAHQGRDIATLEVVMEAARFLTHSQLESLGALAGQVVMPA